MTRSTEGGYTSAEGWSPESKVRVQVLAAMKTKSEGDSTNPQTFQSYRRRPYPLTRGEVMQELETLLSSHTLDEHACAALRLAAAKTRLGQGARGISKDPAQTRRFDRVAGEANMRQWRP